jgi:hypothetical protein
MKDRGIPQHKRVAMGGAPGPVSFAKGGSVSAPNNAVKNPLVAARRNNGVKGMKDGGKC